MITIETPKTTKTTEDDYKYTGPGPVKPEEVVEGAYVSPEMFKWLCDNWDSIPEKKKPLFAAIGRISFADDFIENMKKEGRM